MLACSPDSAKVCQCVCECVGVHGERACVSHADRQRMDGGVDQAV